MQQIYIANPKGGCGETAIAAALAGYCSRHDLGIQLIDQNPQYVPNKGQTEQQLPLPHNTELRLHNLPSATLLGLPKGHIQSGDKVIVPVLPSPTDITACMRYTLALYRSGVLAIGAQVALVGNGMRGNAHYCKTLMQHFEQREVPYMANLQESQNYLRAMSQGLSIFDLPTDQAELELSLWEPLLQWLHLPVIQQQAMQRA